MINIINQKWIKKTFKFAKIEGYDKIPQRTATEPQRTSQWITNPNPEKTNPRTLAPLCFARACVRAQPYLNLSPL